MTFGGSGRRFFAFVVLSATCGCGLIATFDRSRIDAGVDAESPDAGDASDDGETGTDEAGDAPDNPDAVPDASSDAEAG